MSRIIIGSKASLIGTLAAAAALDVPADVTIPPDVAKAVLDHLESLSVPAQAQMVMLGNDDLVTLAQLSRDINKTAYHGGLNSWNSDGSPNRTIARYLGIIDTILRHHGTSVEKLLP